MIGVFLLVLTGLMLLCVGQIQFPRDCSRRLLCRTVGNPSNRGMCPTKIKQSLLVPRLSQLEDEERCHGLQCQATIAGSFWLCSESLRRGFAGGRFHLILLSWFFQYETGENPHVLL